MEYSDEYLREQLPRERPSLDFVPVDVAEESRGWIERGNFDDPDLLSRSVHWTYAIFSELGQGHYQWAERYLPRRFYPWFPHLAFDPSQSIVGLYDKNNESAGFGISINVHGENGPSFEIVDQIKFTRLGQTFPFAIRRTTTELHSLPHPLTATTTCWAQCNSKGDWGIITAGHTIGSLAGRSVPLDNGSSGMSHRCFWQPIDAAFVRTNNPTNPLSQLPILHFPATGVPLTVECKNGSQRRTVAAAANTLGFYKTRSFPVLFFLDRPCNKGDSGALVRATTGEAAGIYLGKEPSPDNGAESGRVLNFAQAMFALNTTAFL